MERFSVDHPEIKRAKAVGLKLALEIESVVMISARVDENNHIYIFIKVALPEDVEKFPAEAEGFAVKVEVGGPAVALQNE